MDIRLIDKKRDLEELALWLPFKVEAKDLPGHTYCARLDGKIIAIAGLRLVEGEMCFLDSMATDQTAPGPVRNDALDRLVVTIFEKARELGFKYIKACTKEDCILARSERHGFRQSDQKIIVKEL